MITEKPPRIVTVRKIFFSDFFSLLTTQQNLTWAVAALASTCSIMLNLATVSWRYDELYVCDWDISYHYITEELISRNGFKQMKTVDLIHLQQKFQISSDLVQKHQFVHSFFKSAWTEHVYLHFLRLLHFEPRHLVCHLSFGRM